MDLSAIQALSAPEKLQFLNSPAGIAQLEEWLSDGLSLPKVAEKLVINRKSIYAWRNSSPAIAQVADRYAIKASKDIPPDLSKPPAYRIVTGYRYDSKHRGDIIGEYPTAKELWQSDFICNYFNSFGRCEKDYLDNYLKEITNNGLCQISNNYIAMFCEVNSRGIIKVLKPTP